jgi:putative cell wall-binding protein
VLFGDADPPGRYQEQYWGGATTQENATPIDVVAGSDYPDHDVTLRHVNRVGGTVTARRPDGTIVPARWALVEAVTPFGTAKATTADDNGEYELLRLEPGTYQIRISMNGEPTNWVSQTLDPLVVDDGAYLTGVDALLETGGSITGTVTTASPGHASAPLDSGTARLYAEGADGRWTESRSTAIRGGWYSFTGVAVGSYRLRFEADDPWSWGSEYYDGPVRGEDADLVTIESGTVLTGLDATLDPRGIYVSRIGGADRYEVSANVSSTVFGADRLIHPPIPVLYIASGANYPDALSAGPAAIHEGGDLLLVAPDSLPAATRAEIERLQPKRIVVVGGPVSVSERVFSELAALQPSIVRIGGADRYEVSRKLVGYAFCGSVSGSGCPAGGAVSVFFATGSNFPDALTAGPAAGHVNAPVLLVPGSNAKPDAPTLALLQRLGAQTGYISGGPNSVSVSFEGALGRALAGGSLNRFSGADRFEVASTMNDWIFSGSETAFLASGAVFADALSGGPVAGALDAPLYLARPECIPVGAIDGIVELNVVDLVLLGGPATLRPEVEAGTVCG